MASPWPGQHPPSPTGRGGGVSLVTYRYDSPRNRQPQGMSPRFAFFDSDTSSLLKHVIFFEYPGNPYPTNDIISVSAREALCQRLNSCVCVKLGRAQTLIVIHKSGNLDEQFRFYHPWNFAWKTLCMTCIKISIASGSLWPAEMNTHTSIRAEGLSFLPFTLKHASKVERRESQVAWRYSKGYLVLFDGYGHSWLGIGIFFSCIGFGTGLGSLVLGVLVRFVLSRIGHFGAFNLDCQHHIAIWNNFHV